MKIDGMGQINYTEALNASTKTDASDFETVLKKAFSEGDKAKLKEACNGFETIMLQSLFKQMKASVPTGGLVEKSTARSMFEDMLDEELMKEAGLKGVGIADMMYKQLSSRMDNAYTIEKGEAESNEKIDEAQASNNPEGLEPVEN